MNTNQDTFHYDNLLGSIMDYYRAVCSACKLDPANEQLKQVKQRLGQIIQEAIPFAGDISKEVWYRYMGGGSD